MEKIDYYHAISLLMHGDGIYCKFFLSPSNAYPSHIRQALTLRFPFHFQITSTLPFFSIYIYLSISHHSPIDLKYSSHVSQLSAMDISIIYKQHGDTNRNFRICQLLALLSRLSPMSSTRLKTSDGMHLPIFLQVVLLNWFLEKSTSFTTTNGFS